MVGDILQPTHLLFVLVVALLVLGPKRLPEVGRTLGSGLRDFRQALSGDMLSGDSSSSPSDEHKQPWVETESQSTHAAADEHHAFAEPEPQPQPASVLAPAPEPTPAPPELVLGRHDPEPEAAAVESHTDA
jgi:sec-independent protein translocase protein TatA